VQISPERKPNDFQIRHVPKAAFMPDKRSEAWSDTMHCVPCRAVDLVVSQLQLSREADSESDPGPCSERGSAWTPAVEESAMYLHPGLVGKESFDLLGNTKETVLVEM